MKILNLYAGIGGNRKLWGDKHEVTAIEIDPINLARSVWQDIYINTGKEPTKCLYNVVELFIFKFLSDLGVLVRDKSFYHLIQMYEDKYPNKEVLEHYAQKCRKEIRDLFPAGDDGTTIINGTIFVDSKGKPVASQANLFRKSILKYAEFGSLKHIKKEFKTKLFETFLKQSDKKNKLGQFFTPRKVVRAIVDMANVEKANYICDPFCGVGGFVLEPIHNSNLKKQFSPKGKSINPKIKLSGYDRGSDEDEERTIILAKANMLIYLSDLVEKNPTLTEKFSEIFNNTFHLITSSNLGSLRLKFEKEEDKPDLILTNPPYISSGAKSIRDEVKVEGLEDEFIESGKGVEGLALKWIINNLRKNGNAFIVIPDSILNVSANQNLRQELIKKCFINCIISLPVKTFFNTPKKTFIIGITKKNADSEEEFNTIKQDFPVFTYLVSNIGETLDANRFEIEGESDLEKAKNLYNQYKGASSSFETDDKRCKIQPFSKFKKEKYWELEKWWTQEEKIELGIEEQPEALSIDEFKEKIEDFSSKLKEYKSLLEDL